MCDTFPIQNDLKEEGALLLLLFIFGRLYHQEEPELNVTHQHLVYADNVNIFGENINTITNTQKLYQGGWSRSEHRANLTYGYVLPTKCSANQFTGGC
jgi:hypothetical protein